MVVGDFVEKEPFVIDEDEVCEFIYQRLQEQASHLTKEDILNVLSLEIDFLVLKGVAS